MGEEEIFDMGLFDSDDLELHLGETTPEDDIIDHTLGEQEEQDIINNSGEEEDDESDPERVAGEDESDGDDNKAGDDADDTSPNLYSSFANHLHEEGLLSSLDSETDITSAEALNEAFEKEIQARLESKYSAEELRDLEAIRNGVSKEDLANYYSSQQKLDAISPEHIESNAELRKQLIYQDYINQGLSEAKALKLLNRSVELESDKEDALEALDSIKVFEERRLEYQKEQAQLAREQEEAAYEAQQAKLKDSIYAKDEIIKGQKLTKAMKDRVYTSMTKVVGNTPEGIPENALMKSRREDPVGFDSKLYYLFELTKGFSDFSILNKVATSKATNNLEQALRSSNFIQDSGMPSYLQDSDSYDGIGDELVF